jgi:hypothetical protein
MQAFWSMTALAIWPSLRIRFAKPLGWTAAGRCLVQCRFTIANLHARMGVPPSLIAISAN